MVYEKWGWGTKDGEQALAMLKPFGSVTALNGHIHQVVTCGLESTNDCLAGGDRMCKCRSPSFSRMLESDGLDSTTEKCVAFFQPIECNVQLRDNGLGLIGNDDHFDTDSLV
jgi:hypothetical protein